MSQGNREDIYFWVRDVLTISRKKFVITHQVSDILIILIDLSNQNNNRNQLIMSGLTFVTNQIKSPLVSIHFRKGLIDEGAHFCAIFIVLSRNRQLITKIVGRRHPGLQSHRFLSFHT